MEQENEPVKKSNSPLLFGGFVVVLIVGGFFLFRSQNQKPLSNIENLATQAGSVASSAPVGPVKEFTVDGSNFAFNPTTITVSKGDTVKITFKDDDGRHNLVVDGYNVSTNMIGPGSTDTITFVADKAGKFEYYCSVSNHRDLGMTGTLIVQ